ncbi:MAG: RluA family pseudouridine synthase [Verrucomicrobiae bacterium]|nr:RluA family pseudouridine synthase [Verrucomicrobiae bacterium]
MKLPVYMRFPQNISTKIIAADPRQWILHENEYFMVVNKPAGILVHPTPRVQTATLIQLLQPYYPNHDLGLVHRLDRETSGLLLIGKNKVTTGALGKKMEARKIQKKYVAIVHGVPDWDEQVIDAPIGFQGLSETNRIYLRQAIKPNGSEAITHLRVLQRGERHSVIEAVPITGRLHQIRVHLASVGLPIVGDKIYGREPDAFLDFIEKGWTAALAEKLYLPRHALHAYALALNWQNENRYFHADWSEDLVEFWTSHEPNVTIQPLIQAEAR